MKVFIRPKQGLKVRKPDTGEHLRPEGEEVEKNSYWIRRIDEGDVEVVKQELKPKQEKLK